jgi:hemoglobin
MSENESSYAGTEYDFLGGDRGIHALVSEFYRQMDTLPATKQIRDMHPTDLSESIQKLYEFLSGWLGGPQLYVQKRGHPRLRMRHFHFPIGTAESEQWLLCMDKALEVQKVPETRRRLLMDAFRKVANHMINQEV